MLQYFHRLLLPGVQSNAIASSMKNAFGLNAWIIAIVLAILLALIILVVLNQLQCSTAVVPFMAIIYIGFAILIIILNIDAVPR